MMSLGALPLETHSGMEEVRRVTCSADQMVIAKHSSTGAAQFLAAHDSLLLPITCGFAKRYLMSMKCQGQV